MCNCATYPGGNVCIKEILDNFIVYTDEFIIKDKLVNFFIKACNKSTVLALMIELCILIGYLFRQNQQKQITYLEISQYITA